MPENKPYPKTLRINAALYALAPGVLAHVKTTGALPENIEFGGAPVAMKLLIAKRGTDITLSADEELVCQALIKLGKYPAGSIVLLDEEEKPKSLK